MGKVARMGEGVWLTQERQVWDVGFRGEEGDDLRSGWDVRPVFFFGFVSSSFHFLTPADWLTGGKSVNACRPFVSVCPTATHNNTTHTAH